MPQQLSAAHASCWQCVGMKSPAGPLQPKAQLPSDATGPYATSPTVDILPDMHVWQFGCSVLADAVYTDAAGRKQWPLTVNVLPDLHLRQVEGSPNDSGAQVAAPPPKSRDGPCSEADDLVGILMGWVVGMLQVLCTHEGD